METPDAQSEANLSVKRYINSVQEKRSIPRIIGVVLGIADLAVVIVFVVLSTVNPTTFQSPAEGTFILFEFQEGRRWAYF